MSLLDEAYKHLKDKLKDTRFIHTLGVVSVAKELARLNGVPEEKAELAALCHDIAKNQPKEEMKKIMLDNNIKLDEIENNTPELWHSIIAPVVAKSVLGIDDDEVLEAMRWHTTGKENMSKLEKIIYIADMIEPSRKFDGVDQIRNTTLKSLDEGVLLGLTHTIEFLLSKGSTIDINTIRARNYLIINRQ